MKARDTSKVFIKKYKEERGIAQVEASLELRYDLWWVWEAFLIMDRLRGRAGTDPNDISLSSIASYVSLKNITCAEDIDFLIKAILVLDEVAMTDYFKRKNEEEKRRNKSKKRGK